MENRPCRRRDAPGTSATRPTPICEPPPDHLVAVRAAEAVRPSQPVQVVQARLVVGEPGEHVAVGPRVVAPGDRGRAWYRPILLHSDGEAFSRKGAGARPRPVHNQGLDVEHSGKHAGPLPSGHPWPRPGVQAAFAPRSHHLPAGRGRQWVRRAGGALLLEATFVPEDRGHQVDLVTELGQIYITVGGSPVFSLLYPVAPPDVVRLGSAPPGIPTTPLFAGRVRALPVPTPICNGLEQHRHPG